MKTGVRFIAIIIGITAAFVTQTLHVQGTSFVMTEESSSVLNVIYNGTDITATGVNNTSPDHWTITVQQTIPHFSNVSWSEPENLLEAATPTGWNTVTWDSGTQLSVVSDTSVSGLFIVNGGITVPNGVELQYTDVSDGAVTTPDTGSTLGLLAVALAALFGASRLRSIRLA